MFLFDVNHILRSRGLEEVFFEVKHKLNTLKNKFPLTSLFTKNTSKFIRGQGAIHLIASSLKGNDKGDSFHSNNRSLVQFSGFLNASCFLGSFVNDEIFNLKFNEGHELKPVIKALSHLLPLDFKELEMDASYVFNEITKENNKLNILSFPKVDIDNLDPTTFPAIPFNQTHLEINDISQSLTHGSEWIKYISYCVCRNLDLSLDILVRLLQESSGTSLAYIIFLLGEKYSAQQVTVLRQRLNTNLSGDLHWLLDELKTKDTTSPPIETIERVINCLYSEILETVYSASELLIHYSELGASIESFKIEVAIENWKKHDYDDVFHCETLYSIDNSFQVLLKEIAVRKVD